MFEWANGKPTTVIIQPNERTSGLDISMDGRRNGQQANRQENQTIGQATHSVGDTLSQLGGMLGGGNNGNNNPPTGGGGLGGLGGFLGF